GTIAGTSGLSVGTGAQFGYQPAAAGSLAVPTLALADKSTIGNTFIGTVAASGTATTAGTVYLAPSGAFTSGTPYTLLTAASGLSGAAYEVRNPTNFTYTTSVTDTAVSVTPTAATALTNAFWKGGFAGNPAVWSVS